MMSRSFILSVLVLLLVCSAFAEEASHQHDQTKAHEAEAVKNTDKSGVSNHDGGCGKYGCCKYGKYGCAKCCHNAKEANAFANEAEAVKNTDTSEVNGYDGGKGKSGGKDYGGCGSYGCCKYGNYGCAKCCHSAEEAAKTFANKAAAVKNTDKSGVDGYDGGKGQSGGKDYGGCGGYGCCKYGKYGCDKCCHNAEEAKAFAIEAEAVKNTDKSEVDGYDGGKGQSGGKDYGGCGKYGCCNYGKYGCAKCCHNAEEAKAFVGNQAKRETKN